MDLEDKEIQWIWSAVKVKICVLVNKNSVEVFYLQHLNLLILILKFNVPTVIN